jgi:hypothetical protein
MSCSTLQSGITFDVEKVRKTVAQEFAANRKIPLLDSTTRLVEVKQDRTA